MYMDNNLNKMILVSKLTKRSVAEDKGITPETLSRHISGKIQITLQDAEDYSKILNCTPQEVLFAADPVPIVGYVHYDSHGHVTYDCPDHRADDSPFEEDYPPAKVHIPFHYPMPVGALIFVMDDSYQGPWCEYRGAMSIIPIKPIQENIVARDSIQKSAYVKIKHGGVSYGHVYPEPGNKYTLYNPWRQDMLQENYEVKRGLELDWATPTISTFWQPEMLGIKIVTVFDRRKIASEN